MSREIPSPSETISSGVFCVHSLIYIDLIFIKYLSSRINNGCEFKVIPNVVCQWFGRMPG